MTDSRGAFFGGFFPCTATHTAFHSLGFDWYFCPLTLVTAAGTV